MIKSLFIPHVFPNYDEKAIRCCFIDICVIDHIDMVEKFDKEGNKYNAVYIHVNYWFKWNNDCIKMLSDLEKKGKTEFYYCERFYWIVLKNTAKKHVSGDRKIRIDVGDLNKDKKKQEYPENECERTPEHKVRSILPRAPTKNAALRPIAPTLDNMFGVPHINDLKPLNLNDIFEACQKQDDACQKQEHYEILANMMTELDETKIDDIDDAMDEMEMGNTDTSFTLSVPAKLMDRL